MAFCVNDLPCRVTNHARNSAHFCRSFSDRLTLITLFTCRIVPLKIPQLQRLFHSYRQSMSKRMNVLERFEFDSSIKPNSHDRYLNVWFEWDFRFKQNKTQLFDDLGVYCKLWDSHWDKTIERQTTGLNKTFRRCRILAIFFGDTTPHNAPTTNDEHIHG